MTTPSVDTQIRFSSEEYPANILIRLDIIAKRNGRSRNKEMCRALWEYIKAAENEANEKSTASPAISPTSSGIWGWSRASFAAGRMRASRMTTRRVHYCLSGHGSLVLSRTAGGIVIPCRRMNLTPKSRIMRRASICILTIFLRRISSATTERGRESDGSRAFVEPVHRGGAVCVGLPP